MTCIVEAAQVEIRHANGLKTIVNCLNSNDPVMVQTTLVTIRNLSISDENEKLLVALGALRPVVALLDSENQAIRRDSVKALRNLAYSGKYLSAADVTLTKHTAESKAEVRALGGLPSLLNCLRSDELEIKRSAMRALSVLSISRMCICRFYM